jgi:hypothetical protein
MKLAPNPNPEDRPSIRAASAACISGVPVIKLVKNELFATDCIIFLSIGLNLCLFVLICYCKRLK